MVGEFFTGARMLLRGFALWRTRPGLMFLGLIPALIAMAIIAAAIIPYGFALGPITGWLTPFADDWDTIWRMLLRGAIGIVLFIAVVALAAATFTALALALGSPFYDRIWKAVETDLGGVPEGRGSGFRASLGESLRLVVFGARNAVVVLLLGLIPVVGGAIGAVTGVVLSGKLLARELSGRSFDARDINRRARSQTLRASRARVLGFGVATQLCFMVPLGALFTMPAAVAGSTLLARSLIDGADAAGASGSPAPGIAAETPSSESLLRARANSAPAAIPGDTVIAPPSGDTATPAGRTDARAGGAAEGGPPPASPATPPRPDA